MYINCFVVETDGGSKVTIERGLNFVYRLGKLRKQD